MGMCLLYVAQVLSVDHVSSVALSVCQNAWARKLQRRAKWGENARHSGLVGSLRCGVSLWRQPVASA
jgi:hypothetical protein